jgi:hypothetical protein
MFECTKYHQILRCSYPNFLLQHPVDMHQATARAPGRQLPSGNMKWVLVYQLITDIPLYTLCQVNPCDNNLDHLIHEICKSTVKDKNLLLFHNYVSDYQNIHVMISKVSKSRRMNIFLRKIVLGLLLLFLT